ncbi:MAG: isochorismatase family protein [Rhodomicrobium sp.]
MLKTNFNCYSRLLVPTPHAAIFHDLNAGYEDAFSQPVVKRQWGAFYGTGLDLQLRRRGIETIVPGGVATNFGVESTARQAWEHG